MATDKSDSSQSPDPFAEAKQKLADARAARSKTLTARQAAPDDPKRIEADNAAMNALHAAELKVREFGV